VEQRDEHRFFADFDDEVRVNDVSSLHELATAPISEDSLTRWAGDLASRHALLSEVVWCSIRWSKSLGLPNGPTLASAFSVVHKYYAMNWNDAGGGVGIDKSKWITTEIGPLLFPGTEDGDDYVVAMLVYPLSPYLNWLGVELTDPDWDHPGLDLTPQGYRVVEPPSHTFLYLRGPGAPVVLDDFRVVRKPFRVIG
jgi:hypothetical protein